MSYVGGITAAVVSLGLEKSAEVVARVYSASKKGKRYTVRRDGDSYSCTCPDYTYRHAGKGTQCKHIRARVENQKTADLVTPLQPHQQRVVDRIQQKDTPGLVVVHGLGSGKTLTSIAAADALGMRSDVVVPAALQGNYRKELDKHVVGQSPEANIQSLENLARVGSGALKNPLLIVDEAHRSRNPGKTRQALMGAEDAKKRLLLTGSLLYNHPSDMAPLINTVAGKTVLPMAPGEFSARFINEYDTNPGIIDRLRGKAPEHVIEVNPKQRGFLKDTLRKYVDYHPGSTAGFPTRTDEFIEVPMSKDQRHIYETLLSQAPSWVANKIRNQLPPTKSEAKDLNAFLTGIRQVSNTTGPFRDDGTDIAPKIDHAVEELKKRVAADPATRAVVYSNWLDAGVKPYERRLQAAGIPYGVFTGDQPKAVRDQYVRDYNEGKIKALLLSGAGSEGLDLKGTRLMQILDPHWNEERIKQVIGRGIRYKSHDHLPEDQRNVTIQRYLATLPRDSMAERLRIKDAPGSVDAYLRMLSKNKDDLNQKFKDLLAEAHDPQNSSS